MVSIRENPILRHSLFATLCLGGSYLVGRKTKNFSSLALNTGAVLAVSIGAQEQRVPLRVFLLIVTTLATTYATKRSCMKKHFTPLKISHAFAHSAAIGGMHALAHHFFPSKATLARRGDVHYRSGQTLSCRNALHAFSDAVDAYKAAGISDHRLGDAQFRLGKALFKVNRLPIIPHIANVRRGDAGFYLRMPLLKIFHLEDVIAAFSAAISTYEAAGISDHRLGEAQFYLGKILFSEKEKQAQAISSFKQAIHTYEEVGTADLKLGKAFFYLGLALYHDEKWEESREALSKAIGVYEAADISGSTLGKAKLYLGLVYAELKHPADAETLLSIASQTYRDQEASEQAIGDEQIIMGCTLLNQKRWRQAEAICRSTIDVYQNANLLTYKSLFSPHFYLGQALFFQDKPLEAIAPLTQAIQSYEAANIPDYKPGSGYGLALVYLGRAFAAQEEWQEAQTALNDAIAKGLQEPLLADAHRLLEEIKAKLKGA